MSKTVKFKMTVNMDITPPLYTYYDEDGQPTNGSVTTFCGDPVDIVYTLSEDNFVFLEPAITNNFNGDIKAVIKAKGKKLKIINNAEHVDSVGIQLIIQNCSTKQMYASPDPQIKNKPPQ